MQAFLTGLLAAALPILLSLGRMVLAVLTIWIVVRCARSLFEPQAQEQWGVMTLANGTRYELCHWETSSDGLKTPMCGSTSPPCPAITRRCAGTTAGAGCYTPCRAATASC
jgi:hypothetical protein